MQQCDVLLKLSAGSGSRDIAARATGDNAEVSPRASSLGASWPSSLDVRLNGHGSLGGQSAVGEMASAPAWAAVVRRVQAEETARESVIAELTSFVEQTFSSLTSRLEAVERFADGALPAPASELQEAQMNELVASRCQVVTRDLEAKLTQTETETSDRLRKLDDAVARLTEALEASKKRWRDDSRLLWEAMDSHTHEVNVRERAAISSVHQEDSDSYSLPPGSPRRQERTTPPAAKRVNPNLAENAQAEDWDDSLTVSVTQSPVRAEHSYVMKHSLTPPQWAWLPRQQSNGLSQSTGSPLRQPLPAWPTTDSCSSSAAPSSPARTPGTAPAAAPAPAIVPLSEVEPISPVHVHSGGSGSSLIRMPDFMEDASVSFSAPMVQAVTSPPPPSMGSASSAAAAPGVSVTTIASADTVLSPLALVAPQYPHQVQPVPGSSSSPLSSSPLLRSTISPARAAHSAVSSRHASPTPVYTTSAETLTVASRQTSPLRVAIPVAASPARDARNSSSPRMLRVTRHGLAASPTKFEQPVLHGPTQLRHPSPGAATTVSTTVMQLQRQRPHSLAAPPPSLTGRFQGGSATQSPRISQALSDRSRTDTPERGATERMSSLRRQQHQQQQPQRSPSLPVSPNAPPGQVQLGAGRLQLKVAESRNWTCQQPMSSPGPAQFG